jgi:hypothetical protein
MKINKKQIEALVKLGAFERGPVEFDSTVSKIPGMISATFSPADEREANRGPVTLVIYRDGTAHDVTPGRLA